MATYKIDSFLKTGEIYIVPEIQNRDRNPFTMQRPKTLFDCFREETFELHGIVRSLFIYDGREALPHESYAKGFIYAQKVEELENYAASHDGDLPDHVATIRFECGGGPIRPGVLVRPTAAASLSLENAEAGGYWELKIETDGQRRTSWHCLYCEGPINEETLLNWECPACRAPNELPIDFVHCSTCGFSPSYYTCPYCSRDFDIRLFNFGCSYIKELPSQRIGTFRITCHDRLKSVVEGLSEKSQRELGEVEFDLPMSIKRVHLESYHKDQANREWFHLSLWPSEDQQRPAILMSVILPGVIYGGSSIPDKAAIAYLHLYSNPVLPDALSLGTEAGIRRTLEDPNVRRAIESQRRSE